MNILIFNWRDIRHSWAGGGEIYIFEQAKRWVKLGHNVTLFCGEGYDTKLPHQERIDDINIVRRGSRYTVYLWAFWYYITLFRNQGFDIVIDVVNGIPFFTPLFSRLPKACFVYHIHDKQFFYEIPFPLSYAGYFIERYIFPLFYRNIPVVAISQTTRHHLISYGFAAKNITLVYCGVNGGNHKALSQKKFSHPTILYLGRIKKYKRVDMLVTCMPYILKHVPNARLIIAGWGTEASHLTDIIMKSKLRRKIQLKGPVTNTEKHELLSKSWVFANPTIGEGWSIAVIEANLHGTPAVAFDVPGVSESIIHTKTGLLAKSQKELNEHIVALLSSQKKVKTLGTNAYKWAKEFSWDTSARKSLRVFQKILQ